jgi:hypothetical protein
MKPKCNREKLRKALWYEKVVRKMLMKSTPGSCLLYAKLALHFQSINFKKFYPNMDSVTLALRPLLTIHFHTQYCDKKTL